MPEPEGVNAPSSQARSKLSRVIEETEVARLTRELTDERRQRVATSEVLRLLRTELSGPEMARELYVSVNTVKTHTKRIYDKLGAHSRYEAVERAHELGLI